MFGWAFIFFIIAVIAAVFGYRGSPSTSTYIAKLIFYFSLIVFIALIFGGIFSSAPPPPDNPPLPA